MSISHPHHTPLRGVLVGAGHLFSARALDTTVRAIYVLLIAHILGLEDYGLFSYGQAYYLSLMWFASFGIDVMLARASARGSSRFARTVQHTLALRLLVIATLTLVSLAGAWLLHDSQDTSELLSVFAIALLARGISWWANQVLITIGKTKLFLYINTAARSTELLLAVVVLILDANLLALVWLHSLIAVITALVLAVSVHRACLPVRPRWNRGVIKAMSYRGQYLSLLLGATNLILLSPLILFAHLDPDPAALGQFALIMQGVFLLANIGWSIGMAALPVLSRDTDGAFTHRYVRVSIRLGWLLGLMGALAGFSLGPPVVELLLGAQYEVAGDMLGYALLVLAFITWGSTLQQVLLVKQRRSTALVAALAGTVAVVLFAVVLIPRFGVPGGIAALLTGNTVWAATLIGALLFSREIGAWEALAKPGCAAFLILAVYVPLSFLSPVLAIAVSILFLLPIASLCGVLESDERQWITQRLGIGRGRRFNES